MSENIQAVLLTVGVLTAIVAVACMFGFVGMHFARRNYATPADAIWKRRRGVTVTEEQFFVIYKKPEWFRGILEVRDVDNYRIGEILYRGNLNAIELHVGEAAYTAMRGQDKRLLIAALHPGAPGSSTQERLASYERLEGSKISPSTFLFPEKGTLKVEAGRIARFKSCYPLEFNGRHAGVLYRDNAFICAALPTELSVAERMFVIAIESGRFF